jgi:hypothetical protein
VGKTNSSESVLRALVNEVLDDRNISLPYVDEEMPVVTSAGVDPSESQTDPGDPNYRPQDNRELSIAIDQLVKLVPDEATGTFYKRVKRLSDDILNSTPPGDDTMTATKRTDEEKKLEEVIRLAVRKHLMEMNEAEADSVPPAEAAPKYEKRELMPFAQMAQELGMSVAGAKQAVDKAWRKAAFINDQFPSEEQKQAYVLDLIHQYIDHLDSSGELTDDDFALLRDHPDLVSELDGFQAFMLDDLKDAGFHPDIDFDDRGRPITRAVDASPEADLAPSATTPAPKEPKAAPAPRGPKAAYKVYGKKAGSPVHTRLKGQAYGGPADSKFKNGEMAAISPEDGKLRVKKADSDHSQLWEPVDG